MPVARNNVVHAPSGTCVARYDKIHLFRFDHGGEAHDETRARPPGNQPVRFELASREGYIYIGRPERSRPAL
jgi:nitrilase